MYRGLCIAAFVVACGGERDDSTVSAEVLELKPVSSAADSWAGLLNPVSIRVGRDSAVYVADNSDSRIHVFSEDGEPLRTFGGAGAGPGELDRPRDVVPLVAGTVVFDAVGSRFHLFDVRGGFVGRTAFSGVGDESVAGIGDDALILASSARWSLPAPSSRGPWPLAAIVNTAGGTVEEIGERVAVQSPFAAHIRNFVLPAGSPDGRYVWLAYLNSPRVLLYDRQRKISRIIERELPFTWTEIPETYLPQTAPSKPGERAVPPFDAVTYDVAVDAGGRAYVLTALESSVSAGGQPTRMAVDVVSPDEAVAPQRFEVAGHYSRIGVAPDAGRLYLLDPNTARLSTFEVPQ